MPASKYKNIDKSTNSIFYEKSTFKTFKFKNLTDKNEYFKIKLHSNYIQLFFCIQKQCTVAINFEHCAINLSENHSAMVYFKEDKTKVFFTIPKEAEVIAIFISIDEFHSLFSSEGNYLFNFNSFSLGKPIIETKPIGSTVTSVLHQINHPSVSESLKPVLIKGKIYELLSYYFSKEINENKDNCPYADNEETVSKIKKAKEIIIKQMNNPPSLAELSKKVGLNIKKLKTDFKEYYGVPVFTFLLNYKMERGKEMLKENQLNVNEIASFLGYSSSSHFIAAFKRKFGTTPKQFAKTL